MLYLGTPAACASEWQVRENVGRDLNSGTAISGLSISTAGKGGITGAAATLKSRRAWIVFAASEGACSRTRLIGGHIKAQAARRFNTDWTRAGVWDDDRLHHGLEPRHCERKRFELGRLCRQLV